MENQREFDIIVWGATGFTGRLVAQYLFNQYGVGRDLKWAMAGRNEEKMHKVRAKVADSSVPYVLADSHDRASLDEMTKRTKVIITTVGPYGKYGSELVASCVESGTHYCDLSGEVLWMRNMIDTHHEAAKAKGVKIVHCCGFDSVPSDMGVYFMQEEAKKRTGAPAQKIQMRVKAFSGGMSGGTYASLNDTLEKAYANKKLFSVLNNPYGLNPKDSQGGPDKKDLMSVKYDKASGTWLYPFIMATINTKVVRRSNALADYSYGKEFRYDEAVMTKPGLSGRIKAWQMAIPLGMMSAKPGSFLKKRIDKMLPDPGQGPNKEQRERGFYNMRFYTTLSDGTKTVGKVTGDMDPGYGSTSKMLSECAVCLVKDKTPDIAGVLTPATAMGAPLLQRLMENAGLTFTFDMKEK